MTDAVALPDATSIGVGRGDVSKYTSGFGVQVSQMNTDHSTETTPVYHQDTSTMTTVQKETATTTEAAPKSHDTDSTLEPLLTTMKELDLVEVDSITATSTQTTHSAPPSSPTKSPTRSRPRSLSSPRQRRPISPPKKVIPKEDRPKSTEFVELEKRRRHTDDEPLKPPEGGAFAMPFVQDGVDRWYSDSGKKY